MALKVEVGNLITGIFYQQNLYLAYQLMSVRHEGRRQTYADI